MKKILIPVAAAFVLTTLPAHAASKYISSPTIEEGFSVKNRGSYEWDEDDKSVWSNKIDGEYGITSHFKVGIAADIIKIEDDSLEYAGTDLKATYRFTEDTSSLQGAIQGGYKIDHLGGADEIEAKLLLAGSAYGLDHKANVALSHEVGEDSESGIGANVAWGSYYDMGKITVGGEYYGDFNNLGDNDGWSDQEHHIGPVVGFAVPVGQRTIGARVGYLVGLSEAAHDHVVKYEMSTGF